jgi:NAD-dependent dihydropyrimidine dehydrogenase PreA subunit
MRKHPRIAGLIAALLGGVIVAAAVPPAIGAGGLHPWLAWVVTVGGLLIVIGVLMIASSLSRGGSPAWLRLDCFLPALRRDGQGGLRSGGGVCLSLAQRVLPASLFSDRQTKRRGMVRRGLRWLGITWLSAPGRRVIQAFCFFIFLGLFFFVCWPYDARPRAAGELSGGWRFIEFGSSDALLTFEGSVIPPWMQADRAVYLLQDSNHERTSDAQGEPWPLRVEAVAGERVHLYSERGLADADIDRLLLGTADWQFASYDPTAWPSHYADNLHRKQWVPAELFLVIDPLVSLSTAIASRSWVWSLVSAAVILTVCLLIPRGFCGYLCPLGTLIDLFDWSIGRRITRFRVSDEGWWVHIKYYLLAGTLIAAFWGVLASGFVAAIPVITRGMLVIGGPLQIGTLRGWHLVPAMHWGHLVSLVMFIGVLSLGLLRPRFWCKYVCPSGATFSLANLFRLTERKVESSCIHCNKCVQICPFDAIKPDFTTRGTDCTLCQTCAGVCPTHAIKFVERGNLVELKIADDPPTGETSIGRRGFLSLAGGTAAAIAGGAGMTAATRAFGARLNDPHQVRPIRPPGSVPEQAFLEMCIRCGECFKACPNDVLQLQGFEQGLEGLWTPVVKADWAGCESSCNACGQVCPTGAIRALPLAEKRVARMGLAIVDQATCLPLAGRQACDLCVQECNAAGYHAIEYTQVGTQTDDAGMPIAGTGFLAPVVQDDLCVGCGLCQTRCYAINVKDKHLLSRSAIIVEAGEGKEDRMMEGSYIELRRETARQRAASGRIPPAESEYFVPGEASELQALPGDSLDDPFGVAPEADTTDTPDGDPFGLGVF